MAEHVFVSHSSQDKKTADMVCQFLEARGIACWIAPRNVPPGARYGEAIVDAIETARAFVLLLSEQSNASGQVKNEVERAGSKNKPIFTLKLSPIKPSRELEYFISGWHWLDLGSISMDEALVQLASTIEPGDQPGGLAGASPRAASSTPHRRRRTWRLAGSVAAALLVVALAAWWGSGVWQRQPAQPAPWVVAYQTLDQGDAQKAQELFQRLAAETSPQGKSQGYTGLAAVAFARGDYQRLEEFARQAEALDRDVVYPHVLRGHLLLQQGKTAEAVEAYRTATGKSRGLPWQQAMAYNRLGRLAAAEGKPEQALEQYDRALRLLTNGHQERVSVLTNKGHVLASLGRYEEALEHYRQAQQLNPADRLSETLLREVEQRLKLQQDKEHQERIAQRVKELEEEYRKRYGDGRPPPRADEWRSLPLTMFVLPLETRGAPSVRAGEEDVFLSRLTGTLRRASRRLVFVDRTLLDKVLAEQRLSMSELADQHKALRVGRLLAARLIATGTLTNLGTETYFHLRVIDTETTVQQAMVDEVLRSPLERDGVADQIATSLVQQLREEYPLQGRIVQATSAGIALDIGTSQGVTAGTVLHVLGADDSAVGSIEVTEVQAERSQARIVEQSVAFEPGWKVKEH